MKKAPRDWRWVAMPTLYAMHDRLLADHGGLPGIRDRAAIESAMARPQHLAIYADPDAAEFAAAYAFGLVRNHGFNDGNKRIGWSVARVFLLDNSCHLAVDPAAAIRTMEKLAAGDLSQARVAAWFRKNLTPR